MNELLHKYYSYCLKADLPSALRAIEKSKNRSVDVKSKKFLHKVKTRFIQKNEKMYLRCDDNFVKAVIESYRKYYRAALLQPKKIDILDKTLKSELQVIAVRTGLLLSKNASFEKIENVLNMEFKKRGFFSIFGTVSPFRSLMVWKKEISKNYQVELPEGKQTVNVIFLEQFLELSWLHYATAFALRFGNSLSFHLSQQQSNHVTTNLRAFMPVLRTCFERAVIIFFCFFENSL